MAKPPPRLFVGGDAALTLAPDRVIPIEGAQWHYLHHVLRLDQNAPVLLFDGRSGEWAAAITIASKKHGVLTVERQTRPMTPPSPLTLYFAPLKKDPTELIIQKGTELGITDFRPVRTDRTIVPKAGLKDDRLASIAVEAAEQCERLDTPTIHPLISLQDLIAAPPSCLVYCDEAGDDPSARWGGPSGHGEGAAAALLTRQESLAGSPGALLIGPEGGFTPTERQTLRALPGTLAVSLGPRVLRAETAALVAISLWQAVLGDI
ncbi:hypothetical protein PB2503_11169 [Parvularcula bermudensis HTCC2503]|uniref:Ribosomal RNA small subunit methyltransferase E n=2 Tax=Parvularcula TaxID=208215 RepID=E0TIG2_PARBH|nr:hypothetical protein PB2503_11169 [Parvularcula bermudensis HTCC2503]